MKQSIKIFAACIWILACASCSEKPDLDDYTRGEMLRYAGKANDPVYFAGHDRLALQFVLGPDPNLCRAVIYWNLRADSMTIDFNRAELPSDTIVRCIENLPENTWSFEIFTFDVYGNRSVPTYLTARTYGVRYMSGLYNREVRDFTYSLDTKDFVITWGEHLLKSLCVEVEYTDGNQAKHTLFVDSATGVTALANVDARLPVAYRTLYKPEPEAIDSFSIGFDTICDANTLDAEVVKPYALHTLTGFDSEVRFQPAGVTDALWNRKTGRSATPYAYAVLNSETGGWAYTGPDGTTEPTWITIDIGSRLKIRRFRLNHFYPYLSFCLKRWEFYAYTGAGVPSAAEGWDNWVKVGEYDNSNDPGIAFNDFKTVNSAMNAAYVAGETLTFSRDNAPEAQYFRVKGLENWVGAYQFSLSEITFYRFAFD
ncbi:MAG: hypothetical protein LBK22_07985 [Tannerella sp.]|jgi:hypothetical protein|nr:hypothetical protein [Tannerella sp.]